MIKHCIECGSKLKEGYKYCRGCGSKIPEKFPEIINYCPDCGNKIQEGHKFCQNCGFKVPEKITEEPEEKKDLEEEPVVITETTEGEAVELKTEKTSKRKYWYLIIGLVLIILIAIILAAASGIFTPNQFPTASCSASPTSGPAPLSVSFIGSGSDPDGTITTYRWNFGDGTSSIEKNPTHTFTNVKSYYVTVTVTDNNGATGESTITITVTINQPPTVSLTANPQSGAIPLQVHFTGTASDPDGSISSYLWDFKDGQTSTQQNPIHTFSTSGTYSVRFTAIDDKGASAFADIVITVLEDTDRDGIPDINDPDDDNDGYADNVDYAPKQNAILKVTISKFRVIDEADTWPDDPDKAQIYFDIYIDDMDNVLGRLPSSGEWDVERGVLVTKNQYVTFDIPDNVQTHSVKIIMWDKDLVGSESLDIDGMHTGTNQNALTLQYDIVTKTWSGDNSNGITNGSNDGSEYTDENDAYLEYNIQMI